MTDRCPVLAVTNRKGGSGKTTTAVNLGAELAARGWRVLLIDADTQGHCALGLGVAPAPGSAGLHGLFCGQSVPLHKLAVATRWDGLDLVPADTRFDGRGLQDDTTLLETALCQLAQHSDYDLILLDTPPSVDLVLLNALHAADGVLIPVVLQSLGSAGVRQLAQLFYQVATQGRPQLKVAGLVPVMCDRSVPSQERILAELAQTFGSQRLLRGIRQDVRLAEAFGVGVPIRQHAPRSRGAMDYYMLTEELLARGILGAHPGEETQRIHRAETPADVSKGD